MTELSTGPLASNTDYPEHLSQLFGLRRQYPSFAELFDASEDPANFVDNHEGFWLLKELIGDRFATPERYPIFQHDAFFHFLAARSFMPLGHESVERQIGHEIDGETYDRLEALGDSPIGYAVGHVPEGRLSRNHVRHCMMLTFLLDAIGSFDGRRVIEIGGGFGSMARLVSQLWEPRSWCIFDLAFVCDLQEWFLASTTDLSPIRRNSCDAKVALYDTRHRNEFLLDYSGADVVIATHSLSELGWDEFLWYGTQVLPKAEWLLYATQNSWPSPELCQRKMDFLSRFFEPVRRRDTQNGLVANFVFRRRSS